MAYETGGSWLGNRGNSVYWSYIWPPWQFSQKITSAGYEYTAEGLHELARYAESHGIKIVLEPMSHFRTHVVNTPSQALKLLELAQHKNLSILLDTYHLITEIRDYGQAIHEVSDQLWGIHACENDRGVPGGGLPPWNQIFDALHKREFEGYIILETYNSSIGDFAYRHGMFHNVCPDGYDFVREGLRFLKTSFRSQ